MKETDREVVLSSAGMDVEFDPDSMLPNQIFGEDTKIVFPLENLGIEIQIKLNDDNSLITSEKPSAKGTLLYYKYSKYKDKKDEIVSYNFVILCDKINTRKILTNQDITAISLNSSEEDIGFKFIDLKDKITKIETISIRQNGYVLKIET